MKSPNKPCLFCTPRDVTRQNEYAYSTRDTYPVSPGHSLIIPFRHCADFFDLDPDERVACLDLLISQRDAIGGMQTKEGMALPSLRDNLIKGWPDATQQVLAELQAEAGQSNREKASD